MSTRKVFSILALCALLLVAVGMFAGVAHAQNDSDSAKAIDKSTAQKHGISQSLASGKKDEEESTGPSKFQMGLGVGSVVVAIIVVKWL